MSHVHDTDMPIQTTPPPPSNAELTSQVAWLTESLEVIARANEALRAEVNGLRQEVEQMRVAGGGCRTPEPKVADPPMFDGNDKQVEGWITACRLKFAGQPSRYPKEATKVIFAASFLSGPPKTWIQPLVTAYLDDTIVQKPEEFMSFEKFIASLKTLYGDPNLERNAMAALEIIEQTTSVAEYISRFAGLSQYTQLNDVGLMRYFYRGLKGAIKDELATRDYKTLRELQTLATRLDARLHERMIERNREPRPRGRDVSSSFKIVLPPKPRTPAFAAGAPPPHKGNFQGIAMPGPPTVPVGDGSTPMELDSQVSRRLPPEEKERCLRLGLCWNCGKHGHRRLDCPELLRAVMNVELEGVQESTEKDPAQE